MGLVRLTEDDIKKLAELFVRAVTINAPIHRDKDGKGPKHCPCCIWEDAISIDNEVIPPYNANSQPKNP